MLLNTPLRIRQSFKAMQAFPESVRQPSSSYPRRVILLFSLLSQRLAVLLIEMDKRRSIRSIRSNHRRCVLFSQEPHRRMPSYACSVEVVEPTADTASTAFLSTRIPREVLLKHRRSNIRASSNTSIWHPGWAKRGCVRNLRWSRRLPPSFPQSSTLSLDSDAPDPPGLHAQYDA